MVAPGTKNHPNDFDYDVEVMPAAEAPDF
jgi:hypothetical protein